MDVDGARQPRDPHQERLHRRNLQGAAHRRRTTTKAIRIGAGADRANLRTVETEDMALSYQPGNALRDRGRMVGDVAAR
jgi:hypothetical protein